MKAVIAYYDCLDEVRNIAFGTFCVNVGTPVRTGAHTSLHTIYHHFQRRCGCSVEQNKNKIFIQFSTRSSIPIGIRNLFFDSPMAKASPSPSSQRKCCSTFSIRTQARFLLFFFFSFFSGGTFINHLILWNKKQPARSTVFEFVSEWVNVSHWMRISGVQASDLVHIYFMAITLYCKILYNSHKFSHFLIQKGYIYTWMGSMTVAVGCWIGVAIFCLFMCSLFCSFWPCVISSSSFFAPLLVDTAFIFSRIVAYKTWMIICVLYAGWFCCWIAEPAHQKGYAQQTATEMGDIAVGFFAWFHCLFDTLHHTHARICSGLLSRSPAHKICCICVCSCPKSYRVSLKNRFCHLTHNENTPYQRFIKYKLKYIVRYVLYTRWKHRWTSHFVIVVRGVRTHSIIICVTVWWQNSTQTFLCLSF